MRALPSAALAAALLAPLGAQSNTIPGLDGSLTNHSGASYFGRRGSAYPNGEVSMCCSYTMCNPGTVPIAWTAPMNPVPAIATRSADAMVGDPPTTLIVCQAEV